LRREGICRLFEQGYGPQEVSMASGHKNWSILARVYANRFDPKDMHLGPVANRALGGERSGVQGRSAVRDGDERRYSPRLSVNAR
jgi:hypothetical protein